MSARWRPSSRRTERGAGGSTMDKFNQLRGTAAPLDMINVDTDMIIPKPYLKNIKRTGLGNHLFAEMRYEENDAETPDIVLTTPQSRRDRKSVGQGKRVSGQVD